MRLIDDAERRARLARRHAVAPQHPLADVVVAASAVVRGGEGNSVRARTPRVGGYGCGLERGVG
jgi:hypothetical protein